MYGHEMKEILALPDEERCYYDEGTGVPLPAHLVEAAEKEEIKEYEKHEAVEEDYNENCVAATGAKPISARFRVNNKGDENDYEMRARLIAQDVRKAGVEAIFTATPPWALFLVPLLEGGDY